jgi:phenylpyruvate tautomerase PptA (4-oxalocrotonate tautomerase family)
MPMCDAHIPADVLPADAEQHLLATVTDILLRNEGADPADEVARAIAWIFVHRPQAYVAGRPATAPYYKFECRVPEGQYNEERRSAVVAGITAAVAEAEGGRWPDPEGRVWVFASEVPDGDWGVRGRPHHLADIFEIVRPGSRAYASKLLANRRRADAAAVLAAAAEADPATV